jgi:hypothetical protein
MSETDVHPSQDEVGEGVNPQTETPKQETTPPEPTPTPNRSWVRRTVKPLLLALGLTGGGAAAASQFGSEGSKKAPDAIVAQPAPGYETFTPEQIAEKARLKEIAEQQQRQQAEAAVPEMSEEEKQERSRAILEAQYPDLLPFVEAGLTPFYDKGSLHGVDYEIVSLVDDKEMKGVGGLNARFIDAITRHKFDVVIAGVDLKHFPRKPGTNEPDMKVSNENQKAVNDVRKVQAVIAPATMKGQDAPWTWEKGGLHDLGMFTVNTEWPLDNDEAVIRVMFHKEKVSKKIIDGEEVRETGLWLSHHIDDEPEPNAPGGGAN